MLAKEVMTLEVITLPESTPLKEVITIIASNDISCIIATRNEHIVGIISERDLIKKILLPKKNYAKLKLKDCMTKRVITVEPTTTVADLSALMEEKNIKQVPVVKNGALLGMVTERDLVSKTHELALKNKTFMRYQRLQSIIIITFFIVMFLLFLKRSGFI